MPKKTKPEWVYDAARMGMANTRTGQFVTDLLQAQEQQRMANQSNYGGLLVGLGNYIGGGTAAGLTDATWMNTVTSDVTTNIYYNPAQWNIKADEPMMNPCLPVKPDDEFTWLRKRVDEVCGRN